MWLNHFLFFFFFGKKSGGRGKGLRSGEYIVGEEKNRAFRKTLLFVHRFTPLSSFRSVGFTSPNSTNTDSEMKCSPDRNGGAAIAQWQCEN